MERNVHALKSEDLSLNEAARQLGVLKDTPILKRQQDGKNIHALEETEVVSVCHIASVIEEAIVQLYSEHNNICLEFTPNELRMLIFVSIERNLISLRYSRKFQMASRKFSMEL